MIELLLALDYAALVCGVAIVLFHGRDPPARPKGVRWRPQATDGRQGGTMRARGMGNLVAGEQFGSWAATPFCLSYPVALGVAFGPHLLR